MPTNRHDDSVENDSVPKLIVVSESASQRLAFGEAVKSAGYHLVDCIPSAKLHTVLEQAVDLWLIDSDDDVHVIEKLKQQDKFLLGFTPSPHITDVKAFDKWQRHLKRKLMQLLGEVDASKIKQVDTQPKFVRQNWEVLLVLGASMGGPNAVKVFLDHLPNDLPIAIVLAQHTDNVAVHTLPRILTLHNMWQCEVISKQSQLSAGKVWLVSPKQRVLFNTSGWVVPTNKDWSNEYRPSISDTMISASETFAKRVIHIIFSGMGDDGLAAAPFVNGAKSDIWVQSPESCECDSQPNAVLSTGFASFVGEPVALASKVIKRVSTLPKTNFIRK